MAEYIYEVYDGGKAWNGRVLRGEIIRCRDCKNRAYSEEVCSDECKVTFDHIGTINGLDAYARRIVKPNDTCSWAERDDQ